MSQDFNAAGGDRKQNQPGTHLHFLLIYRTHLKKIHIVLSVWIMCGAILFCEDMLHNISKNSSKYLFVWKNVYNFAIKTQERVGFW